MEDEKIFGKIVKVIFNFFLCIGIGFVLYKLPRVIADKWSYYKIKNRKFEQEFEEDETDE